MNRIRLSILGLMLLTLAVYSGSVALYAQTSTEGSITGTVLDSSGATVSGVAVTIQNNGTNAEVKLTTDGSGFYKAPLLEPGTYTVSFSAPGYATYHANNVIVVVGQVTNLEPRLTVGASSASVEVIEQAPVLNLDSPDFQATLTPRAMESIPINNRRWSSLAMTTPGVVSDSNGYGLVAVRGISPVLNNIEIDGADDNQAYYSEERGRTREAYSTSGSAVQEFAVNTGVYSAEFGRAAGGVITSVTKSGTNQLHGQAYFWDRESKWNAYNDYALESVLDSSTGQYVSTHIKPEDLRKIYGFTVGGALIKDKLFWIYTYDQHTHVFPGTAVPNSAASFYTLPTSYANLPGGAVEACNLATGYLTGTGTQSAATAALPYDSNYTVDSQVCTLAARQGYANGATTGYDQGVAAYDAGIAGLVSDMGTVSRFGYQEINTPKLDYQITPKEHLSVLYHRLRWDSPGGVQTTATDDYGRDTWGNDYVKLDYGVTKLTSLITTNIGNELLYQFGRELDDESQQPYTPYTLANLEGTAGSAGNVPEVAVDTTEGMYIGSPYYSYRKALPDEHKWQVGDVLYWNRGNHSFKFGVDAVHNYDLMNNTYESNGDYVYNYLGNYFNDQINANAGKAASTCNSSALSAAGAPTSTTPTAVGGSPCYADFYQGFGSPAFSISTMDTGIFGQDNWKVSPRLTLELGLRWDYEALPAASSILTAPIGTFSPYPGLTNDPTDRKNFGPRIGFSYDVTGKGNTVVRGGYGIYYGRINNGELLNFRLNTGSPLGQYTTTYKATTANAPLLPNIETGTGAASATPTSNFLAPNLRNPQVQEFDLMVQHGIGKGTFIQASYLGALGRELPNYLDVNLNPTPNPATGGNVAGDVANVVITVADSSGKGPLGPNGTTYTVPTFTGYGNTALFGSVANNFQAITEMISNVNSNYNAAVAEVLNRSLRSIQFDASYTWSHALDFAQNAVTSNTAFNEWYNPYSNARVNYGDSSYNVPNRFAGYALYNFPNLHSNNLAWAKYVTNDWSLDDSFQMQNGLPYTIAVSGFAGAAVLSDWNGGSGTTMLPMIGPNTMRYPRRIVDDARLQKAISFENGRSLQLMANMFNVANHQNVDGLGTTAYKLSGGSSSPSSASYLTGTATYQGSGSGNNTYQIPTSSNNSGFLYTPREIEISARFIF
ncbi:MAG: carboxypeptidase regulatory-like domain-containing protein [Terracidiphilus sp.]